MTSRRCAHLAKPLAALLGAALAGGCGGGRYADLARQAEERGDAHVAYDYYCRAAQDFRGSATVADGIDRTRAAAAAHWERLALAAGDDGRHDEAWRCWMKTLEIQPDHATAADMIRQLESQQSIQVASARDDWLRRGPGALPMARLEPRGSRAVRPPPVDEPVAASDTPVIAARPDDRRVASARPRIAPRRSPTVETSRGVELAPAVEPPDDDRPQPLAGVRVEPPVIRPASPPAEAPADGRFEVVRTYSLKDRRFPREGDAIDGIVLKLKDTDSDDGFIEVDLDLTRGGRRVRKVRELRVGRSLTFRGASGQTYRMTIISAHHKTHTVRIGFKPE